MIYFPATPLSDLATRWHSNELTEMADGFARYVPEKDLPEEIRKLPTSETRCHYCGVSYLVHHEVKKLESLVEELQSKLQSSYERNEELIKVYNAVFNRANKVEEEKEAAEQMYDNICMSIN